MSVARFTVICPECVRIEYSPTGRFVDAPSLFAAYRTPQHLVAPERELIVRDVPDGDAIHIATPRFDLRFTPRAQGFTPHTLRVRINSARGHGVPDGAPIEWFPGKQQVANLGGTLETLDMLRGPPATPLPPGLLALDGWHLVDDSHGHLLIGNWVRSRDHEGLADNFDWYLFAYGADFRAALRALTTVSGPVPLPRRCALGSWYSRFWPHTADDYRQIVSEYAAHDLPLDVMVMDMDWHREGWTGWSWNRELLPDAEALLKWFHDQGLAITLNLHPADGVGPHEDRYPAFMHALGVHAGRGETVPFDAGNRPYVEALTGQVLSPLEASGVDFWWLDWQQDRYVRSVPGLTNLQWLNKVFFDHTAADGRRGLSFSRWAGERGGWGDHRYPVHFSGDAHTGWDMLAFQVPFTSTAGNVGCFFWSHDIGGHFGPRNEEATARWVQFGALSAALRLHSARTGALDRRPWTYGPAFFESMKQAFALRSSLFPYIYTQAERACRDSVPLLRPMYVDRPSLDAAFERPAQYMFGERLLAAPIVAPGIGVAHVATQSVWFPPQIAEAPGVPPIGQYWYRWSTGERFQAGDEAFVAATIDEVPLFAPGGVPIPTRAPTQRMSTEPLRELVVQLWPGRPGAVEREDLYEDDGLSREHERGRSAHTPLVAEWSADPADPGAVRLRLTVGPTDGAFAGQPHERSLCVVIGAASAVAHTAVNGRPHASEWARRGHDQMRVLQLPCESIRRATVVEAVIREHDPQAASLANLARRFAGAFGLSAARTAVDHRRSVVDLALANSGADAAQALAIGAGIGFVRCGRATAIGCAEAAHHRLCDTFGWLDQSKPTDAPDAPSAPAVQSVEVGGRPRVEIIDRIGLHSRVVVRCEPVLIGDGRSRAAAIPDAPEPLPDPPLGLRATRLLRAAASIDGRQVVFESIAESKLRPLEGWLAIGPFPWDWRRSITEQHAGPERGGLGAADRHAGIDGRSLAWIRARTGDKWPVDLRASFAHDSGLAYAALRLLNTRAQNVTLVLDSSDKLEAWLNGQRVFSQDGFDTSAAEAGFAPVTLRAGSNILLVKCASGGGGWGFSAAIDGQRPIAVERDVLDDGYDAPPPPGFA